VLSARSPKGGVSLVRLPSAAQPGEYERASQEIEDLLRRLPGIVAVYRTGTVSAPGISDLDRIAVVEGDTTAPPVWSRLSERTRYLAMHAPFLVDRAVFGRHRWFAHIAPLVLSSGTAVELEDPPMHQEWEWLLAAESMLVGLLSVAKQVSTGVLKVRPTLCQLNNIRHALALARITSEDAPGAWKVAEEVQTLRSTWFTSPDSERRDLVTDVAARTPPALLEALWSLGERSGSADAGTEVIRLRTPWSNVVLQAADAPHGAVTGGARMRVPLLRSARAAELAWRAARPRIALHPGILALLAGKGSLERERFRETRDQLVRAHDQFLTLHGRGYSGIGFASAFMGR
jgi:hypothetical protein